MKETRDIMGMPVSVEIADASASKDSLEKVFDYFTYVDKTFSTYKSDSEISRINRGELSENEYSPDMVDVFRRAEETKQETKGYFDIRALDGSIDPSGIVKGWAIQNAAELLESLGHHNIYVEAGGDIQTGGTNAAGGEWSIGIRNPFNSTEIVKVVYPHGKGIATSGTYIRGAHIYNPHTQQPPEAALKSLTVIGPNVYEADRFATAAFAMGNYGIQFIDSLEGFEGYSIDKDGRATVSAGFSAYTKEPSNA